jgi:FkbM family methyltransferase
LLKHFSPQGLYRAFEWEARFEAVGFAPAKAWRSALSRQMRWALVESRIEHLPAALRTNLGLVVDVGTNLGQWISAFMIFAKVDRIEAFEPNPEVFEALTAHFGNRPGTRLHQLAAGAEHTTVNLNITRGSGLASILIPSETMRAQYTLAMTEVIKQVPVKVTPLDEVIPYDVTVDLMKVDVQGFEHEVLRGARQTLKRTRALLIETNFASHYVGDGSFGSLYAQMTGEMGFDFWDVSPPYRGTEGQALWADAVFVNPTVLTVN